MKINDNWYISLSTYYEQEDFLLGIHNYNGLCDHCDSMHSITRIGFGLFEIAITYTK